MFERSYAAYAQTKILEKYGTLHGISKELVDRVFENKATPEELTTYTQNADKLAAKFKADMRQTEPEAYSDLDIEIITAMAATNYASFQSNDEPFAKVVPPASVAESLKGNKPPAFYGFGASLRHSENLAPDQVVSQFGLDYKDTPYLYKDGPADRPVPFLFSVVSPMNKDLRDTLRVPFDPRIFDRIAKLADDPTRGDLIREMASTMTRKDVAYIAVRGTGSQDETNALTQKYKDLGYAVRAKSADPPYTGNTMPQYGQTLAKESSFSDLIQEMCAAPSSGKTPLGGEGTAIYLSVPKRGDTGTGDPTLPRGSDKIKIAEWKGRQWEMTASKKDLDEHYERALAGVSDEAKATLKSQMITHDTLTAASAEGRAKAPAGVAFKPEAKKGIKDRTTTVKRGIVQKTLGSVVAALRFMKDDKDKKKKDKDKKKKNKGDGPDDHQESKRKRASSGD
ncbi:hypothetical protein [Sorangium sp. So ce176]|uniref:hypothetical protein n=1 Tax=Sorangium sp. So ce176 TaxID=3133286 RepID=UPI003F6168CC